MLLAIAGVLFVLWLIGFALHLVGSFIHIALVLAIVVAIAHFLTGMRGRTAQR